ncbi:MAG: ABC transporter ATP-binding protein [bacterium]|nr:MAG: ABC transporter ATP-binding protein [bacterium]
MKSSNKLKLFFSPFSKLKIATLVLYSLVVAVIEISGMGVIVPFISILNNPSIIQSNQYLNSINQILGNPSEKSFLIYLGLTIIAVWFIRALLMGGFNYLKLKYTYQIQHLFSKRIFESYLYRDYLFHVNHESSVLLRNARELTAHLANGFMVPILHIVTDIIIIAIILTALMIVDVKLTLFLAVLFGAMSFLVYTFFKKKVGQYGKERNENSAELYKVLTRSLQGIKDVKILGKEHFFYERFVKQSSNYINLETKFGTISASPILLFEFVGIASLILIMIYMINSNMSYPIIISMITVYAIAAYRLLPRVSSISVSLQQLKYFAGSTDIIYNELNGLDSLQLNKMIGQNHEEKLGFNRAVVLDQISFKYPESKEWVLNNISLVLKKNTSNAFVGTSGAGKTTLVDVIMSFFSSENGTIKIDDTLLTKDNERLWRKNIGYIPQQIFLYDDTLAENIVLGVDQEEIDNEQLNKVIQTAQLEGVIQGLPNGVHTLLGENGVRLSGGQRQRVGIARALYHDPDLLIMDEATSALDNLTEAEIVDEINQLSKVKTLIVIAHRLTTIQNCDVIHVLDKGQLKCSGTYDELLSNCEHFKKLARIKAS